MCHMYLSYNSAGPLRTAMKIYRIKSPDQCLIAMNIGKCKADWTTGFTI